MRLATAGTILATLIGLAAGVGGYTFVYARGYSYLTNDPAACANCHVMEDYYRSWLASSHRSVATCNDCHTPHNFVGKYATKASNGFWHSFAFTTGRFPEPLQITARNRRIARASCTGCHADVIEAMDTGHKDAGAAACVRCHGAVGHPR
jgi:cytochrome c nitrite reductase small subunit